MIENFFNIGESFDFMMQQFGENVKINDIDVNVIIHRNNNKDIEELKILSSDPISRGDLIQFDNNTYLVNDDTKNERYNTYYKAVAQRCNYNVNFVVNNIIYNYPTIITTEKIGLNSSEITTPENKIVVIVQVNDITKRIKADSEFIKFMRKYKVTGTDWSKNGLILIYAEETQANAAEDDLINEIPAGSSAYSPVITVTPEEINLKVNGTEQINATVKVNGNAVENPTFTYISDNISIATVNNSGLVTGIAEGNCNIIISYVGTDDNTYSTMVPTIVEESAQDNTEIILMDENEDNFKVYPYISNVVDAKLMINGVEDITAVFTFSIKNDHEGLPYSTVTLDNITDTSAELVPNTYHQYGTCTLTVTLDRDNTITKQQTVTMSNL